ncbi:MAG: hypothetical protein K0R55_2518, partial [Sporomusa sp.]|nr:hypothetical protein [Sporomusa sp.]
NQNGIVDQVRLAVYVDSNGQMIPLARCEFHLWRRTFKPEVQQAGSLIYKCALLPIGRWSVDSYLRFGGKAVIAVLMDGYCIMFLYYLYLNTPDKLHILCPL